MSKNRHKLQKSTAANTHASKPFFKKSGERSFFMQSKKAERSFFDSSHIQTKFKLGQPGDKYEQEAETMADNIVQKSGDQGATPTIMRDHDDYQNERPQGHAAVDREKGIMRKPIFESEEDPQVQAKSIDRKINASLGRGQPLEQRTKSTMESAFNSDFSRVKVHTDTNAMQLSSALGARAFTVGNDIYFNRGNYRPNSPRGKHLLAHELTHSLQQGKSGKKIQRAMKFELQTSNYVWRTGKDGKNPKRLPRKFGPKDYLHKIAMPSDKKRAKLKKEGKGMELQSETGGYLEFETAGWFRKWKALEKTLQDAVDMTQKMNLAAPVTKLLESRIKKVVDKKYGGEKYGEFRYFPFSTSHLNLKSGEQLVVQIVNKSWNAGIQSSESFAMDQFASFLKEHYGAGSSVASATLDKADSITDRATVKYGVPKADLPNLESFIQIIAYYIRQGQTVDLRKKDKKGDVIWKRYKKGKKKGQLILDKNKNPIPKGGHPSKFAFKLMSRTSFSSMYEVLLNSKEKQLFQNIVNDKMILKDMGVSTSTPFFKYGHGGGEGPTVHRWLKSIINPIKRREKYKRKGKTWYVKITDKSGNWVKTDLLSRPYKGSHAMGVFSVEKEKGKKNTRLLRFETRSTSRTFKDKAIKRLKKKGGGFLNVRVQPAAKWVAYAKDLFRTAAIDRKRKNIKDNPKTKKDETEKTGLKF